MAGGVPGGVCGVGGFSGGVPGTGSVSENISILSGLNPRSGSTIVFLFFKFYKYIDSSPVKANQLSFTCSTGDFLAFFSSIESFFIASA